MKVYYLRLTEADFTKSGNIWTSEIIDLYQNDSYTNYSTTKSGYGLNSLGDNTWTGLTQIDGTHTDAGIIQGGRFVDTTGRIDLVDYSVTFDQLPGSAYYSTRLDVYSSDKSSASFPEEWASIRDVTADRPLIEVGAYRHVKLALNIDTTMDMASTTAEFLLRIQIGSTVMNPMYARTRTMLDKFPEWMAVRELDNTENATPTTLGGNLINSVAGEWLTDLYATVNRLQVDQFIATADVNQKAWTNQTAYCPEKIWSITGDNVELARVGTVAEYYELADDDDAFYWNEDARTVFVNKLYANFKINGITYPQTPRLVWNWFDEFGLLVDLPRHYLETNDSYKARILDVYTHQPGVGTEAFKFALRRELNLWKAFGATPDSDYPGATPHVYEMSDLNDLVDGATPYMSYDDVPTERFRSLVEDLATRYPTGWGYFKWNEALYDVGGTENKGFGSLPYVYDATPADDAHLQSGIGDGDDLYLYRPDEISGVQQFDARLKIRGLHKTTRSENRKVSFDVDFWGRADRKAYANPAVTSWLTVEITDTHATPSKYYLSFQMTATSDISASNPSNTSNSYSTFKIWADTGNLVTGLQLYGSDGYLYDTSAATPLVLHQADVSIIKLRYGKWDPNSNTYTDVPGSATSRAWFSDNSSTKVTPLTSAITGSIVPVGYVVYESLSTSYVVSKWTSEKHRLHVDLNGVLPDQTTNGMTLTAPTVVWDTFLELTPNKEYVVQLVTTDSNGNYGGLTLDADNDDLLIPANKILLNSSASWTAGQQIISASTVNLAFATGTSITGYPVSVDVWDLFESSCLTNIQGTVDENGPWRNGIPSEPGNANFDLTQVQLSRAMFGIPDTTDYSLTWIGIDVLNNNNVVVWLDTNTIKPLVTTSDISYPNNAIEEVYSNVTSEYSLSPFIVKARLRPGLDPQWYPRIHSGWFYDKADEYYVYVQPATELVNSATPILNTVSRQGAPIMAKTHEATPRDFRQVAFWDTATPELGLTYTEILNGSGTTKLFLSYEDIYDVSVLDNSTGLVVSVDTSSGTNEINTSVSTDRDTSYSVSYKVNNSFYADNEYLERDGSQRTRLVFDKTPTELGVSGFDVTYETSIYDPATPIDLPLNTFYTVEDEGFIFLSFDDYELGGVEVRTSPSKLIADGQDYMIVTLRSLDQFDNPKPNQSFVVTTSWGTLSATNGTSSTWNADTNTLTTDRDGFGVLTLTAASSTSTLTGTISVSGASSTSATFDIEPPTPSRYRLVAVPSADRIPADGFSKVYVYGAVENTSYNPVPYARVAYRRARNLHDLFTRSFDGQVLADADGKFVIGPFTAATPDSTGYWLLAAESWSNSATPYVIATPNYSEYNSATPPYGPVGDVVFWHEYPFIRHSIENITGMPLPAIQMATPADSYPGYGSANNFPVNYDEATPNAAATPVTINWGPPPWYALPRYEQYQLGFLGTGPYSVDFDDEQDERPDYRDV